MWNPAIAIAVVIPILGEPEVIATDAGPAEHFPILGYEEGVHVNMAEEDMTPALEAWRVTPATPRFALAGVETAYLRFDDEDAAQAAAQGAGLWLEPPVEEVE